MNRYELTCRYCGNYWETNYYPQSKVHCDKCQDTDLKVVDRSTDKIDYYQGCPDFEEDTDFNF